MLLSFYSGNYYLITAPRNQSPSPNRHVCHLSAHSQHRKIRLPLLSVSSAAVSTAGAVVSEASEEREFEFSRDEETEDYSFDGSFESTDSKRFETPPVEVKELEDLPDQWRRSRLAWLCKELPSHRSGPFIRILNAQRKWIRQVDCTYIAVHCLRIRENESAFRVYKWMMQQHWFQFDFALATKLADYMGKERKHLKCREIFDDIVNAGLVPNESTFHILIVAYLSSSSSSSNCLDEACSIYNQMIHLGNYKPRLSLHNSLFRALVSKTGRSCKRHLEQAEFIFQNLTMCGLKIHNDLYGGLIWLHSFQDVIDRERIKSLRSEMKSMGMKETTEVLVSVLRAYAKEGNIAEAEITWTKILSSTNNKPPVQAFLPLMEVYSRIGKPMKSLEIFRNLQETGSTSVVTYNKIIEILCKARETELAESLMMEFIDSGVKPVMRSFIDIMEMYADLGLHDKVGSVFLWSMEKCRPNQIVYSLYLDSLVQSNNLDRAEEIFNQMHADEAIGVDAKSCNLILRGYLACDDYGKAKMIYNFMREKKYEIESSLIEKLEYILSLSWEEKKPISLKLSKEQREILVGLLLGGLRVKIDEEKNSYAIDFIFKESFNIHSFLKRHIYNQFHEWLDCKDNDIDQSQFTTISHSYFKFYADQFCPQGRPEIPKLIHRWLTPRVLAYWYMYGGYRTSSGDILLKLRFGKEDAARIAKTFKARSLNCRVRRKGGVFWLGFLGRDAEAFWELTEPFVLADLKESLEAGIQESSTNGSLSSDSDENIDCMGGDPDNSNVLQM